MWLESHGNLARHPKTRRLMQRMGWTLPTTIGNLHLLWYWALEYAPTGDLTKYDPEELTHDLDLGGATPEQFLEAMIHAGFIDRSGEGAIRLHDWPEYTAKSLRPRFRRDPDRWHNVLRSYGLPVIARRKPTLIHSTRNNAPAPEPTASTSAEREPKLVGLALRAGRGMAQNGISISPDSATQSEQQPKPALSSASGGSTPQDSSTSIDDLSLVPKSLSGRRNFNDWWRKLQEQYQNKGCPLTAHEQHELLSTLARNPFTAVEKLQYSVVNFETTFASERKRSDTS